MPNGYTYLVTSYTSMGKSVALTQTTVNYTSVLNSTWVV